MARKINKKVKFRLSKRKLKKIKKIQSRKQYKQEGKSERSIVKQKLLKKYGNVCWLCLGHFIEKELTIHHIIPYHISKHTTEEESCIICFNCHFNIINKYDYDSKEYIDLMKQIEQFR